VGHAVWSIGVPVALVESRAGRAPWLGRTGLVATAALYVLGCLLINGEAPDPGPSAAQLAGAALAALVLIVAAFAVPRPRPDAAGPVPRPILVGAVAFVGSSAFFARPETWFGVASGLVLIGVATVVGRRWSRRRAWDGRHRFALAAGALLTYAWGGFVLTALLEPRDPVRWIGNAVFAGLAVTIVAVGSLLHVKVQQVEVHHAGPA